ncbi:hypothetical protein BO70DRAFT_359266 [Aspergillus heteromorphus CBS 117.55]|uniref:Uncharacterized protein n=1 Tax=Aspergillus heteromorphus CBS 117.55 TaxID=1448321 RepID=A0A317WVS0_9EURO|nr:uncharacterized protein BO70DRAFT_359266 [Aspergillus heteromorphus CBS 117.55]PWY88948.1 hypothetical protein BO70DRAFT_359266 [Aspergillus heteromorphus CBS 117.55]
MTTAQLVQLTLSDEELSTKPLTSHHLQAALEALHQDGVCIITNGLNPARCVAERCKEVGGLGALGAVGGVGGGGGMII